MLNKILNWYAKLKREKYLEEWKNGYDWAAGRLLRKEETPASIEDKYGYDGSPFDAGIYSAIDAIESLRGESL